MVNKINFSSVFALVISGFSLTAVAMEKPLSNQGQYFAIQSTANGKFVSTNGNYGEGALIARSTEIGDWEKYEIKPTGLGFYSIKGIHGKYLQAKDGGDSILTLTSPHVSDWEKFTLTLEADGTYGIKAFNGKFVSAIDGGNLELQANSPHASGWEQFKLVPLSSPSATVFGHPLTAYKTQRFAIRSLATGKYVTVECATKRSLPLTAQSSDYKKGGVFTIIHSPKSGSYYIQGENGLYLSAARGGGGYVHSVGGQMSGWETLKIVQEEGGSYSIRVSNGQYLSAQATSDNYMRANAVEVGSTERFEIIPL